MNNIPVFLSSDNNYAPYVAATLASICYNTKSFCEFYIIDCGISRDNKLKIEKLKNKFSNFSIEFIKIDIDKYFKNLPEIRYITRSMYSRFLIPYLKPQINKAIYTDVDIIFIGDIKEMYNEELDGYALGAVWEENMSFFMAKRMLKKLNLSKDHKYFNSGSLIIDCKKWRDDDIYNKLIEISKKITFRLDCPDQDLLNIYFDNNYKIIDSGYNLLRENHILNKYNNKNTIVLHFTGDIKPWHINPKIKTNLYNRYLEFWKYAKMTEFYKELLENVNDDQKQEIIMIYLSIPIILELLNIITKIIN